MSSAFTSLNTDVDTEDRPMNEINTTPLVDVMLVLLIVFMITIPVITQTVPVELPKVSNQATKTKPENINIAVNRDGQVFWNAGLVEDDAALLEKFERSSDGKASARSPHSRRPADEV